MGFFSAMKGANNNWGQCTSRDFAGPCYLEPKNMVDNRSKEMMISGSGLKNDYIFTKDDIANCKIVASGGNWIWFHIDFNDGKSVEFIFDSVLNNSNNKQTVNVAWLNFIDFMGIDFKNV